MATALGSTTDPKGLVPGDPKTLHDLATTLTGWSKKFNKVGDGLRDLKIPGWAGQAHDVFWPVLSKEKTNWYFAADAMSDAASAVTSYAGMLSWAQGQATTAIGQWKSGDHEAAQTTLDSALKQLKPEADKLTKKLKDLAGGAAHSPGWLVALRSQVDDLKWMKDHGVGKTSQKRWSTTKEKWLEDEAGRWHQKKEWGRDTEGNWFIRDKPPPADDDEAAGSGKKPNVTVKIAEWTGKADVWSANTSGKASWGGANWQDNAGLSVLGVNGTAGASYTNGRLQAGVSGNAYLVQGTASGSVTYGLATAQGNAKAYVGADASANVGVGKDGLHAGAEAFAGAKATGTVSGDVAGVGAGVTGEAWAGVGASADVDAGMKDGKFTVGGNLGVGLGIGGKVSFDVTVDPSKVLNSVDDAADAVGSAAGSVWDHTLGGLL